MKVRKPDLKSMLSFNPKVLEFHFSDSDLNLEIDGKFDQQLIVHCFEYFERKLLDIVSSETTNQIHSKEKSIELIQMAIDKTVSESKSYTDFRERSYEVSGLDSFIAFSIKIVMKGTKSTEPPFIQDLRVIALAL